MSEARRVVSRRTLLKTAGMATGTVALTGPHINIISARALNSTSKRGLKLALMLPSAPSLRWTIAKQIGVNHAIVRFREQMHDLSPDQFAPLLRKTWSDLAEAGLSFAGIEGNPIDFDRVKLGLPGRDEDIGRFCTLLKAMSEVGVPMVCYNWMAGIGWYRTRVDIAERGGALTSEFDNRDAEKQGLTELGEVSHEKLWQNFQYFIQRVVPVADKYRIQLALHPDDPPIAKLRGIARIAVSAANLRRMTGMAPSPYNGVAFCQANFKAMGEDVPAQLKEFCAAKKVFLAHFRDIDGQGECFRETFHDNGPTDMAAMLQAYYDAGYEGPIRPDHAPSLAGEDNDDPGYAMQGKILAIGYMKGIMDALGIPAA